MEPKIYYIDSNIYRFIDPSKKTYIKELHEAIEQIKSNQSNSIIYSDAHLLDLKDSQKQYIEHDLNVIGQYAGGNYLSRNPIDQQLYISSKLPLDAFNEHDYSVYNETLQDPFDISSLFEGLGELGDSDEAKKAKEAINLLFNSKISDFTDTSQYTSSQNGEVIPNFNPDMTIAEFMKNSAGLLTDEKAVTNLRKYVSEFMNKDDYSFDKWKFEFNDKFKDTIFQKSFLEYVESSIPENQKNDPYIKFTKAFCDLELLNVTQEKAGGKTKKFNYQNINCDAMHAYYASYSHYVISDDKGFRQKAHILYSIFGFQTVVLSKEDIIASK